MGVYDYDPETNSIEIGCSIERKNWGKGFAGETIKIVIAYLMDQEEIHCIKAWCAADNIGSRRIMESAAWSAATSSWSVISFREIRRV